MSQNIVLITIDSLRADHCGFMGSEYDLTPTLDRLAGEGVVFENALAPGPRTPSSMPVIFTGEFFQENNLGVYEDYETKSDGWLERQARIGRHLDRFRSIPERLREHGFDTAGITANPWTTRNTNFDDGFDVFHAVQERTDVSAQSSPFARFASRFLDSSLSDWLLTWPDFYDIILEARDRLEEPYFLWVFLLDPHQPYITPRRFREENTALGMYYGNVQYNRSYGYTDHLPEYLENRLRRAYRDSIRSVDAFLERMLSDLGDDDPTMIIHADHGESFFDHGTYGHRPQLYRENLHVPLVLHNSGFTGAIDQPVSLRQLPQIVIDSAILTDIPDLSTQSQFTISKTEEAERKCVRNRDWAYIRSDETYTNYLYNFRKEELFHLPTDQSEKQNLIEGLDKQAHLLRVILAKHESHQKECSVIVNSVADIREEI